MKAWPCWEFHWSWEVHISAIERVELRRNEKIFFNWKKVWSCFFFSGRTDQYLLFFKSLSIFCKKCFCFKIQRISCEPIKWYLFSLPHVFHIKYWNKKLVLLGHLLQFSEFLVAKSLMPFRRESHFSVETNSVKIFLSSHSRKCWRKFNKDKTTGAASLQWCTMGFSWWGGSLKCEIGTWSYYALKQSKPLVRLCLQFQVPYQSLSWFQLGWSHPKYTKLLLSFHLDCCLGGGILWLKIEIVENQEEPGESICWRAEGKEEAMEKLHTCSVQSKLSYREDFN